jgi:hypothetical protein
MNKPDLYVIVILISFLTINLLMLIFGYLTEKSPIYIPFFNVITGITIIIFGVIKSLEINIFYFEFREIAFYVLEFLMVCFAVYSLVYKQHKSISNIINYTAYCLHIIVAFGMLILITTFKIKRLI